MEIKKKAFLIFRYHFLKTNPRFLEIRELPIWKNKTNFETNANFILAIGICILFSFWNCSGQEKADDGKAAALLLLLDKSNSPNTGTNTNTSASVTTTTNGSIFTTVVNATSNTEWTYVSLKSGGTKVSSSENWDLKFQRMNIGTYSGTSVSGGGNGGACTNGSTDFTASFTGTECSRSIDEQLISSGGGGAAPFNSSVNPLLSSPLDSNNKPSNSPWYNYSTEHILTTRGFIYIITGSDGSKYLMKIVDYYSSAGTSGNPKFTWKKI